MTTVITDTAGLTIEKLFGDFYVVPDFQREYVWKKKQVAQLLSDLYLAYRSGGEANYFVGSIVVYTDGDLFQVVDGQQRLATLYVLFSAIRDRRRASEPDAEMAALRKMIADIATNEEGEDEYRHRVALQYTESNRVLRKIGEGDAAELDLAKTAPGRGLHDAYRYCAEFLEERFGEQDAQDLKKFAAFIQLRVEAIRVLTGDFATALTIFEILNYRGVVLSAMDLLKNLMFRHTDPAEHSDLVGRWDKLLSTLKRGGEPNALRFLRYYLVATYDFDRMPQASELFGWITDNSQQIGYEKDPFGFVEALQEAADKYLGLLRGKAPTGEDSIHLQGILYQKTSVRQHLPLLLAGRRLRKTVFDELARWIEALVWAYAIAGAQWNEIEQAAPGWCKKLRGVNTRADLDQFVDQEIKKRITTLSPLIRENLQDTSEIGKGLLKYTLAKLTHAIEDECGKDDDFGRYFNKRVSVEHILPQRPSTEARESFKPSTTVEEHIYRLGNLTLLFGGPNAMGRNKAYREKKGLYARSDYELTKSLVQSIGMGGSSNKYRKTEEKYGLRPFARWGAKSVTEREGMLLKIAAELWGI